MLGERRALVQALSFINLFQALAMAYVSATARWIAAAAMNLLFIAQLPMQRKLATDPTRLAPWYCASAIPPFCWSMLAGALAVRFGGF